MNAKCKVLLPQRNNNWEVFSEEIALKMMKGLYLNIQDLQVQKLTYFLKTTFLPWPWFLSGSTTIHVWVKMLLLLYGAIGFNIVGIKIMTEMSWFYLYDLTFSTECWSIMWGVWLFCTNLHSSNDYLPSRAQKCFSPVLWRKWHVTDVNDSWHHVRHI